MRVENAVTPIDACNTRNVLHGYIKDNTFGTLNKGRRESVVDGSRGRARKTSKVGFSF